MAKLNNELKEYQTIPRKLIFDNKISDRARFLYCYMASKPNDWDFYLKPMATELGYSIETLRKYINELIANGWLVKGKQENENGIFGAVEYTLKANRDLPKTENTEAEKFRHGKNPTQHNKDSLHSIDNIDNKDSNKEKEDNKLSSKKKKDNQDVLSQYDVSVIPSEFIEVVRDWCQYKKERNERYKTQSSFLSMVKRLIKLSNNNVDKAKEIVEQSIANNYAGLFELKQRSGNANPIGFILEKGREEKYKKSSGKNW